MSSGDIGYWPSRWPSEDGGGERKQLPLSGKGLNLKPGDDARVVSREVIAATMAVLREPGEIYLLRHTAGDDAISWVERIDPETLELIERSPDLLGGPTWPGGLAAHANGSLYVVFGNHAHRLNPDTSVVLSVELPRKRPYNSFVILPDGNIATKDFAGLRPGQTGKVPGPANSELLVLAAESLEIIDRLELPEPSIARLSARPTGGADADIYLVGDTSLLRVRWDGAKLKLDNDFVAPYRTFAGQTYGWDAVIAENDAWFLDNGAGSENYTGTFRGAGVSSAPLHLVRVNLKTGAVAYSEICGKPNGVVANPPVVDETRKIVVGFDSANGVMAAFDYDELGNTTLRWRRDQYHACHMILFPDTGEIITADFDHERMTEQSVILDTESGEEKARIDSGSPVQSVVFPNPGFGRDFYTCSFTTISRISFS